MGSTAQTLWLGARLPPLLLFAQISVFSNQSDSSPSQLLACPFASRYLKRDSGAPIPASLLTPSSPNTPLKTLLKIPRTSWSPKPKVLSPYPHAAQAFFFLLLLFPFSSSFFFPRDAGWEMMAFLLPLSPFILSVRRSCVFPEGVSLFFCLWLIALFGGPPLSLQVHA